MTQTHQLSDMIGRIRTVRVVDAMSSTRMTGESGRQQRQQTVQQKAKKSDSVIRVDLRDQKHREDRTSVGRVEHHNKTKLYHRRRRSQTV